MSYPEKHIIFCGELKIPRSRKTQPSTNEVHLHYCSKKESENNVILKLPQFVDTVYHLADRFKDLLEIAGYVYAGDRKVSRGNPIAVEYQKWSRDIHFHIPVRDLQFWSKKGVKESLSQALIFMSGDLKYEFTFHKNTCNIPFSLFDTNEFKIESNNQTSVILFSGGLDSLTGIIDKLINSDDQLCLISHNSKQPGSNKTRKAILKKLIEKFPNRIKHFNFYCHLTGDHALEESQRTRSFLYFSIAFTLSSAFSQSKFFVYENGITSINFPKQEDMKNARASLTTHPKTVGLLQGFFRCFVQDFTIEHPYFWKTKSDIVGMLNFFGWQDIIDTSVSCGHTFQNTTNYTHCGTCSQCIDRRFAIYINELEEFDTEKGIYEFDFISESLDDPLIKTALMGYIALAKKFKSYSIDKFYNFYPAEINQLMHYVDGNDDNEKIERVYELCKRHGNQVEEAIKKIFIKHHNIENAPIRNNFFELIAKGEYDKDPVEHFVESLCEELGTFIRAAFFKYPPTNEEDLNHKISAFLEKNRAKYHSEYPSVEFALARTIPDHSYDEYNLFIESKYIRTNTTPSVASEGIAADLIKYPLDKFKLFIVYDPNLKIRDEKKFIKDFESKGWCKIFVTR